METKPLTISKLKSLLSEIFFDKQDSVTKITENSVLNGFFYGIAKVGQKALVDIANVEAQIFPEFASGSLLDNVAVRLGVPTRLGASGSSTFIRLVGAPGTQYVSTDVTFSSISGVVFELATSVTIPTDGYIYANIRSRDSGKKTNVDPTSISNITPAPVGHEYLINEFQAIGGADKESDELFRQRIINFPNLISESTLEKLNQIFIKINSKVLRTVYFGLTSTGKNRIGVLSQDGSEFSVSELDELLVEVQNFISISDLRKFGNNVFGISIENVEFLPIDVDFRVDIIQNYNPDAIRIDIQTRFSRLVDYRFFQEGDVVQWDDLLALTKATQGVRNVPDKTFLPQTDINVPNGSFPRFRGFIMRDLSGNILVDQQGNLDPIYFSNSISALNSIL